MSVIALGEEDDLIVGVMSHIQREPRPREEEIGLSLYSLRSLPGTSYS